MRVFVRASIEVVYTYKYLSRYLIKFIKDLNFFYILKFILINFGVKFVNCLNELFIQTRL